MNTSDVIRYGHGTLTSTLNGVAKEHWETPGVCGVWSVKDILSHLTSFELVLIDAMNELLGNEETPNLDALRQDFSNFNDGQVELRRGKTPDEVLAEYNAAHQEVMRLIEKVPVETRRTNGALTWYGPNYDLEDFIIYTNYAHKREHSAEINKFRDTLEA